MWHGESGINGKAENKANLWGANFPCNLSKFSMFAFILLRSLLHLRSPSYSQSFPLFFLVSKETRERENWLRKYVFFSFEGVGRVDGQINTLISLAFVLKLQA